jgi:DNA-binding NarL/FixJ family response regulator
VKEETIRILVVDGNPVIRQGLVELLGMIEGLEVVGDAADGLEAIVKFHDKRPDITLIDLALRKLSGLEVIRNVRRGSPEARFIVLATYEEDLASAVEAGAQTYMLKGVSTLELVTTIRKAHAYGSQIETFR